MKTFKLCSLAVLFDDQKDESGHFHGKDIPLVDGLIINKEEAQKNWLIDAVVEKEMKPFFEEYFTNNSQFMVEVTITKRTNDPATLICEVKGLNELKEHVSVHLDGVLVVKKDDLSDTVLRNLITEGYKGDELLEEFKRRKKNRGQAIQTILSNQQENKKI